MWLGGYPAAKGEIRAADRDDIVIRLRDALADRADHQLGALSKLEQLSAQGHTELHVRPADVDDQHTERCLPSGSQETLVAGVHGTYLRPAWLESKR